MQRYTLFTVQPVPATDTEGTKIEIEESHNGSEEYNNGYTIGVKHHTEDLVLQAAEYFESIGIEVFGRVNVKGFSGGLLTVGTM